MTRLPSSPRSCERTSIGRRGPSPRRARRALSGHGEWHLAEMFARMRWAFRTRKHSFRRSRRVPLASHRRAGDSHLLHAQVRGIRGSQPPAAFRRRLARQRTPTGSRELGLFAESAREGAGRLADARLNRYCSTPSSFRSASARDTSRSTQRRSGCQRGCCGSLEGRSSPTRRTRRCRRRRHP